MYIERWVAYDGTTNDERPKENTMNAATSVIDAHLSCYHGAAVKPVHSNALSVALANAAADRKLFAPSV